MEIDAVMIRTLSRDEQERHVKEGLCFVCHKTRHMSQECPMGKSKGNVKKGHKGKGRKRFMTGCCIQAALREDDNLEDKEYDSIEEDEAKTIHSLMKQLSPDECIKLLTEINKQDF